MFKRVLDFTVPAVIYGFVALVAFMFFCVFFGAIHLCFQMPIGPAYRCIMTLGVWASNLSIAIAGAFTIGFTGYIFADLVGLIETPIA